MSKFVQSSLNLRDKTQGVLFKFHFGKSPTFPNTIEYRERGTDAEVDAKHALEAAKQGKPEDGLIGKERDGRVDTGRQVIKNLAMVRPGLVRTSLVNNGFYVAAVYAQRTDKGNSLIIEFRRIVDGAKTVELPRHITEALRKIAGQTWSYCHVWENPTQVHTLNFTGTHWSEGDENFKAPQHELIVRDGLLGAINLAEHASVD